MEINADYKHSPWHLGVVCVLGSVRSEVQQPVGLPVAAFLALRMGENQVIDAEKHRKLPSDKKRRKMT